MIKATVHYAKTHLSRLLKEVQRGESVIILRGDTPVARLVAVETVAQARPKIGEVTTTGVAWTEDAFRPMTDAELKEWGL